jgi:hypothetical protein
MQVFEDFSGELQSPIVDWEELVVLNRNSGTLTYTQGLLEGSLARYISRPNAWWKWQVEARDALPKVDISIMISSI